MSTFISPSHHVGFFLPTYIRYLNAKCELSSCMFPLLLVMQLMASQNNLHIHRHKVCPTLLTCALFYAVLVYVGKHDGEGKIKVDAYYVGLCAE